MKKLSKILLLVLMAFIAVPSFVLADAETIIKRQKSPYGKFLFNVEDEYLVDGDTYKWGISLSKEVDPNEYYDVTNPDFDNRTVDIMVDATEEDIMEVIKHSNNVYLTIINSSGEKVVDDKLLDVRPELLQAFELVKGDTYGGAPGNAAYILKNLYGFSANDMLVHFEKITDAKVINYYLLGVEVSDLPLKGLESFPKIEKLFVPDKFINETRILNSSIPEEDGLYYLWMYGGNVGTKGVYGYKVVEVGEVTKEEDKTEENKVTTTTKKNVTTTTKNVENTTNNKVTNTTQKKEENPKTADTNVLYILAAMLVFGAIGVIGNKKAKNN